MTYNFDDAQKLFNSRMFSHTEANSKFLNDIKALAANYDGYAPTSKANYVVFSFDTPQECEAFMKAIDADSDLQNKYPQMDYDQSSDRKTLKVAETGF